MTSIASNGVNTDGIFVTLVFVSLQAFIDILTIFFVGIFPREATRAVACVTVIGIFTSRVQTASGHTRSTFIFIYEKIQLLIRINSYPL